MDIMAVYNMISKTNMCNCVQNYFKGHLIVLCEFLEGNKAHAMHSSIWVHVNVHKQV